MPLILGLALLIFGHGKVAESSNESRLIRDNGHDMRKRMMPNVVVGLSMAALFVYVLFPRFQNNWSCKSSVPETSGQIAGLEDARARKAHRCTGVRRCKFGVHANPEGTFRVSLHFVESDFFEGCVAKGHDAEELIYSPGGEFLRVEEAPFD
jgi:hypothetical protein